MNKPVAFACLLFALPQIHSQGSAEGDKNPLSPDGQWRYECVHSHWPENHQTSTTKRALDLMGDDRSLPHADDAEVVWAPDSKRFAFSYSPPHAPHSTYVATAFYQLRGEEWVLLHSAIDEESSEKAFAALAKHLPKGVRPPRLWRADPNRLVFKVRNWTAADTPMLYVPSHVAKLYVVTLKFDLEGKCKITSAHKVAQKDLED